METVFFNIEHGGRQTFQVRRDDERQLIFIRPFAREGHTVMGVSDEFVFDPAALKAHPDHGQFWTDHMCWGIENRNHPLVPSYARAIYPFTPKGAADPEMRTTIPRLVSIFVPFADSPVSEMMVMCYVGDGLQLVETPAAQGDRRVIERQMMPQFDIRLPETCAPDGTVRGEIILKWPRRPAGVTVYLESDAGYLPRREIELRDGRAEFAFSARDLARGESARIDVGFRYYRAKNSARIAIG